MICDNCEYNPKTCNMVEVRKNKGIVMDYTEYVCLFQEQKEMEDKTIKIEDAE